MASDTLRAGVWEGIPAEDAARLHRGDACAAVATGVSGFGVSG